MITLSNDIEKRFVSSFRKARRESIRCVRLRPNLFFVSRNNPGHGRYLVHLIEIQSVNAESKVMLRCQDIDSEHGDSCWGARNNKLCTHGAKAFLAAYRYGRKQQQAEAA